VPKNGRLRGRDRYPGAMLRLRYQLVAALAVAGLLAGSTQAASQKVTKLYGQVGGARVTNYRITLKNKQFVPIHKVKRGVYTFVIQDRSTIHNYHLKGPGVDKKTSIAFLGTKTWAKLKLKKGTYRYWCDPHKTLMHGSFKVT